MADWSDCAAEDGYTVAPRSVSIRLAAQSTMLARTLSKPAIWIVAAVALAILDLLAPRNLSICVLHALLLLVAWRLLNRRHVSLLTATSMVAVVIPGLVQLIEQINTPSAETQFAQVFSVDVIAPARVWTTLSLAAAGLFHINLQRARRRRVALRRELQQKVRGRTVELRKVNQTLRGEIARRETTERRLDQTETNLRSLIDRMQLQVLRKNRDGVITYANETFIANLGRDPDDVIGRLDSEFYPPEMAESYRADDIRVMDSGQSVDHVEEHPLPDGQRGYVQVFKAPEYNEHGDCVGIQVIFWDVTEKQRSAIALRESEARKRALFEMSADAVLLVDPDKKIIEANSSAASLFALPADDLVGKPLTEVARLGPDADQRIDWDALGDSQRHEMTLFRVNRTTFESELSVHPIPMGNAEGMAVIVRDVTIRRRAFEALQEAKAAAEATSRTKSEFMAGVSHELRTPLGGITGLTDLLLETPLSERGRQYVDMIRQSGSLLSDVIEDILDFSAIEAGQVQIHSEPIDLHRVVGSAFKSIAARAVDKPLALVFSIDPSTPRRVVADPKRMRQIIMNLAGNAVKFTPSGEVHVRVSPARRDDLDVPDGCAGICIEVKDTGVGIPEDKHANVFEAFERGEEGTTRRFGGTGLGLSICHGLVKRMGGRVDLTSQVDVGSTFKCLLALEIDKDHRVDSSEPLPVGSCVVCVTSDALEASLVETLGAADVPHVEATAIGSDEPCVWIVSDDHSAANRIGELRRGQDIVVWMSKLGSALPPAARAEDPILFQPILADELLQTIRDPQRQSDRSQSSEKPATVDTLLEDDTAEIESPNGLRLLLVDDSVVNRRVIHDQLATAGYQIDLACGGQEAINKATQTAYDCVLMDLQMPDMDGTEATAQIRKHYHQQQTDPPPTIALTAHVTDQHREQCRKAGMLGFVTKPVDRAKLLDEIEKYTAEGFTMNASSTSPDNMGDASASDDLLGQTSWRDQMKLHSGSRPDTLLAICNAFLEEVPQLVDRIHTAVDADDAAALKTASHTLKSCLAYVAVDEDVSRAALIEQNSGKPDSITKEQLSEIDVISKRWIECVKTLRDETAASMNVEV